MTRPVRAVMVAAAIALAAPAHAQVSAGGQAILGLTWANSTPFGDAETQLKVVQPVFMAHAVLGRLRLDATLNLEGLTMKNGELMPGIWGEGFNDRRHPHTTVHEFMASFTARFVSLSAGKGFVPYGTDDPMNRPALRFPVNHHLAQVLERAVVIGAVRTGPVAVEASLFNGDEPESPGQWPNWRRFGDSWSVRGTALPAQWLELQVSTAEVASPEHRNGAGPTQRKWSTSARVAAGVAGGRVVGLAEWASASELEGVFRYHTALAEAQYARGPARVWMRLERTERPEEERLLAAPYRSVRPHHDNSILGVTRWGTITVGAARTARVRSLLVEPLAEVTFMRITNVTGVVQRPVDLFGREHLWSASIGVRISGGAPMHRMGRYGVVSAPAGAGHDHQ